MGFASFLSGGFTTMAVINPPEKKLANRTSVCNGLPIGEPYFSNYLNHPKGSDEFPVGPARNSTQGCFAHDLHFEDLIDA